MRVSNHIYFKSSTCVAPTTPKVIIRRKPTKGTLVVTQGVLPLRHARTEQGQKCIGRPMRTAIVQYTAPKNATGLDTAQYDVIFPSSCIRCTNYEIAVTITITSDMPPETTKSAPPDDGDG